MEGPRLRELLEFVSTARKSLKLVSPWIKGELLERIFSSVDKCVAFEVILRVSDTQDLKITDPKTFKVIRDFDAELYINPRLHAKMVIVDDEKALVGSANITYGGLEENLEFMTYAPHMEEVLKVYGEVKALSLKLEVGAKALIFQQLEDLTLKALLLEDIPTQSLLKVPTPRGFLVCRLVSLYTQDLEIPPLSDADERFMASYVYAQRRERGAFTFALLKPLMEYLLGQGEKESRGAPPLYPVSLPAQAFALEEEEVFKTNMAGYPMGIGVECGHVVGASSKAYLDLNKVCGMHMAILGSTGSGKTTFMNRLIQNLKSEELQVFVFDVYGEYRERLLSKEVEYIPLPNTVFPVSAEDLKELLRAEGVSLQEKSTDEREFFSFIRRALKPDLSVIAYTSKPLDELLRDASPKSLREDIQDFLNILSLHNGEDAVKNQGWVCQLIRKGISSTARVVIFDLKDLILMDSRLNVVGLALRELFNLARRDPKKRLVVLEEAHHFAPERGVDHTSMDRLSFQITRRIALEGRKFHLGLVVITQRPANLSKYVLSQMNTQAVFRLITKNDLEAVSPFFGPGEEDYLSLLPSLRTGSFFLTGIAVPFPMLAKVELG